MKGIIFDIKQFAVFDGPGIRTTVFLKGCPLRCQWCHNPEGLSFRPQLMVSRGGCTHCGKCREVCRHPNQCRVCGKCIRACPLHLRRIAGTVMESDELVQILEKDKDYLKKAGGGVTFSGGEPTAQPEFLLECLQKLSSVNRAIETSGYCWPLTFGKILKHLDYIIMDVKMADREKHIRYTGVDNDLILRNLELVKKSGKPFRIRIPVIPGVNDSKEDFRQTAELLAGSEDNFEGVELLPYHRTAGAKYEMLGADFRPDFDTEREPNMDTEPFETAGIPCKCL